jgi:hypothetical protein
MEDQRTGKGEAAGHLMAELYDAKDRWRHGQMTTAQLKHRVQVIRNRQRAFDGQYIRMEVRNAAQGTLAGIEQNWGALAGQAGRSKDAHNHNVGAKAGA